jgi:hypothetical protein
MDTEEHPMSWECVTCSEQQVHIAMPEGDSFNLCEEGLAVEACRDTKINMQEKNYVSASRLFGSESWSVT